MHATLVNLRIHWWNTLAGALTSNGWAGNVTEPQNITCMLNKHFPLLFDAFDDFALYQSIDNARTVTGTKWQNSTPSSNSKNAKSVDIAAQRSIYIRFTVISNVWCSTRHEITFHYGKVVKTLHKLILERKPSANISMKTKNYIIYIFFLFQQAFCKRITLSFVAMTQTWIDPEF